MRVCANVQGKYVKKTRKMTAGLEAVRVVERGREGQKKIVGGGSQEEDFTKQSKANNNEQAHLFVKSPYFLLLFFFSSFLFCFSALLHIVLS